MKIEFKFRFPIEQTSPTTVVLKSGPGAPIINPEFVRQHDLSNEELDRAAERAIREIAIVKQ